MNTLPSDSSDTEPTYFQCQTIPAHRLDPDLARQHFGVCPICRTGLYPKYDQPPVSTTFSCSQLHRFTWEKARQNDCICPDCGDPLNPDYSLG